MHYTSLIFINGLLYIKNLFDIISQSRQSSKSHTKELYGRSAVHTEWFWPSRSRYWTIAWAVSDWFRGKNGFTKMVNKAVFGRRLCDLTAEKLTVATDIMDAVNMTKKTRNFVNIKVDYRSKEGKKNLMIGTYVHQLYFWKIYHPGLKFGKANLQGKRRRLAALCSLEWNGSQTVALPFGLWKNLLPWP